jgi:hypothetical protein
MGKFLEEKFINDEFGPNTPMSGWEFDYIRVRVGLTWKSIGKQAHVIGRDKPYSISALRTIRYKQAVKLKFVFMLFSCLPEAMFRQLRKEWKEGPVNDWYVEIKQQFNL